MSYGLKVPSIFSDLLASSEHQRLVELYLSTFDEWYSKNDTPFFKEYTDHGPQHVQTVLETAAGLINSASRERFSDKDAAVLICSTILHDVALHFKHQSFIALVTNDEEPPGLDEFCDERWPKIWKDFISESARLSDSQKIVAFGTSEFFDPPDLCEPESWTKLQERYVGEFLRRHHPRIAYEIPFNGIPGAIGDLTIDAIREDDPLHDFSLLAGLVARSHGMGLRNLIDPLVKEFNKRVYRNDCHPIYLMVLLRIADYLQLQADRAPNSRLKVMRLKSPLSISEWGLHDAVKSIDFGIHDDPEVVFVQINPKRTDIEVYLKIEKLISDLQHELDQSWAVLGEVYGRFDEKDLGITIRRIRSNIEDKGTFGKKAGFIPQDVRFSAANSELTKLLIKPLYGDYPEIAVRELVQNAVDACRERAFLDSKEREIDPDDYTVTIRVTRNEDSTYSLIVEDSGVGMSMDVLRNYFLNAGASFRSALAWKKNFTDDKRKSQILRSGKFGVGALAAFLVADDPTDITINVHTRRFDETAANALTFKATLSDKPISVDFEEKEEIGTRIEVITKNPPSFMKTKGSKKSADEEIGTWDWYCLKWPEVLRITSNGTKLKQKHQLPADENQLQEGYNWVDVKNFSGIGWTFEKAPALVCNGIKVIDEQSYQNRAPDLVKEESLFGEIKIPMPNLSVFDKNGLLPLTLDRLRIDYDQLSFLGQLSEAVLSNILGALVVAAPDSSDAKAFDFSQKMIDHFFENIDGISSKNIGWVLADGSVGVYGSSTLSSFADRRVFEFYSSRDLGLLKEKGTEKVVLIHSKKCIFNSVLQERAHGRFCRVLHDRSAIERIKERIRRADHEFERYRSSDRNDEMFSDGNDRNLDEFFEYLIEGIYQFRNRKKYDHDHDLELVVHRLKRLHLEMRGMPPKHRFREIFHFLENVLHSEFGAEPPIHHVLRLLEQKFHRGIAPNRSDARLVLEIIEAAIASQPEVKIHSHSKFNIKNSLVDWNKINKLHGDEDWFVSEWVVPKEMDGDENPISQLWNEKIPSNLVPQSIDERIAAFSDAEKSSLNLEEWLVKRTKFLGKKKG